MRFPLKPPCLEAIAIDPRSQHITGYLDSVFDGSFVEDSTLTRVLMWFQGVWKYDSTIQFMFFILRWHGSFPKTCSQLPSNSRLGKLLLLLYRFFLSRSGSGTSAILSLVFLHWDSYLFGLRSNRCGCDMLVYWKCHLLDDMFGIEDLGFTCAQTFAFGFLKKGLKKRIILANDRDCFFLPRQGSLLKNDTHFPACIFEGAHVRMVEGIPFKRCHAKATTPEK